MRPPAAKQQFDGFFVGRLQFQSMTTLQVQNLAGKIAPFVKEYNVQYIALFGSRARGDAKRDSDFDFLVRFERPKSLLKVIHMERQLSRMLKRKVDLVTEGALNPLLKNSVLEDAKVLYEKK